MTNLCDTLDTWFEDPGQVLKLANSFASDQADIDFVASMSAKYRRYGDAARCSRAQSERLNNLARGPWGCV